MSSRFCWIYFLLTKSVQNPTVTSYTITYACSESLSPDQILSIVQRTLRKALYLSSHKNLEFIITCELG